MKPYTWQRTTFVLILLAILIAAGGSMDRFLPAAESQAPADTAYIVQAHTTADAAAAVADAGGTQTHELAIINSVAAELGPTALARLQADPRLTLHADVPVRTTSDDVKGADGNSGNDANHRNDTGETDTSSYDLYPSAAVRAHVLHTYQVNTPEIRCRRQEIKFKNNWSERPLTGESVTVAVIDTGLIRMKNLDDWQEQPNDPGTLIAAHRGRCLVYRDFVATANNGNSIDGHGHGTHIIGTIADNRKQRLAADMDRAWLGVAPKTNVVIARALGNDGTGSYADVIAAIDWIVANKDTYKIRVLNLSLYAPVTDYYWADPLNQAVMRAWQAGIVVVTVAGNGGPDVGTITAPGNVPYVITVGALTSGRYTASGLDELADYSARGPTESAFVKPEVLVPATRTIAAMPANSTLATQLGGDRVVSKRDMDLKISAPDDAQAYYELSGTSMAAAEVSGIVALMLQANPDLTPDQVKYRLLATARPAIEEATGEPLYTLWEQGAGLVDAEAAIFADTTKSANFGLDIDVDLDPATTEHFWGNTIWDEATGEFQLIDPNSGEVVEIWGGGRRAGSGSTWLWTSGRRAGSGGRRAGSGGRRAGSGSTLLWAGSDMPWTQPNLQSGGMTTDLVIEDGIPDAPAQTNRAIWLPMLLR